MSPERCVKGESERTQVSQVQRGWGRTCLVSRCVNRLDRRLIAHAPPTLSFAINFDGYPPERYLN
jgi:hypothetical protein